MNRQLQRALVTGTVALFLHGCAPDVPPADALAPIRLLAAESAEEEGEVLSLDDAVTGMTELFGSMAGQAQDRAKTYCPREMVVSFEIVAAKMKGGKKFAVGVADLGQISFEGGKKTSLSAGSTVVITYTNPECAKLAEDE